MKIHLSPIQKVFFVFVLTVVVVAFAIHSPMAFAQDMVQTAWLFVLSAQVTDVSKKDDERKA